MKPAVQKGPKSVRSKAQLTFEKLIDQIEGQQHYHQNLKNGLHQAGVKINTELKPLTEQYNLLLRDVILTLHRCTEQFGVDRYNRDDLEEYIKRQLHGLIAIFGYQDEKLSQLLRLYADTTLADMLNAEGTIAIKTTYNTTFGFKIDAEQMLLKGRQNYLDEISTQLIKSKATHHAQNNRTDHEGQATTSLNKGLQQQLREVYMQLVKELHPDREPDEDKQLQKNEIIKEVTAAYKKADLLMLLRLSSRYLTTSDGLAATSSNSILKQHVKILQEQLNQLNRQTDRLKYLNDHAINFIDKNGHFSPQKFAEHKRSMLSGIKSLKKNQAFAQQDAKAWFRAYLRLIL